MVITATFLVACATGKPAKNQDPGSRLIAAGFTKSLAGNPKQLSQYRTLPQGQMVSYQKNGVTVHVYADVDRCGCIYEGSDEALNRYSK